MRLWPTRDWPFARCFTKMAESRFRFCNVSGCREMYAKETNTKENGVTVFQVPKLSLETWQEVMPTSKLTKTSRICSRHFDENDVLKGVTDSLNVFHPYKKWKLRPGAFPKHFLVPTMTGNLFICVRINVRYSWP